MMLDEPMAPEPFPILDRLAGVPGRSPVWLMRQAGRYLPEYREIRAQTSGFLDLCYTPALAAEVTLQPIRRFAFDAAILFSDILVVPDALGQAVRFVEGEGPQLDPIRDRRELGRLQPDRVVLHLAPVFETVRRVRAALPQGVALLGFAGAPWTVAAYMMQGTSAKSSAEFEIARSIAATEPAFVDELITLLEDVTVAYLSAQVTAGAHAVQLFDSWAGLLDDPGVDRWCLGPSQRIVSRMRELHPQTPVLLFPRGVGEEHLKRYAGIGASALSLDSAVDMGWAARTLRDVPCLQGNLDPQLLLGPIAEMLEEARRIVAATAGRAHVFNLGHGIVPATPPETVAALVADLKSIEV